MMHALATLKIKNKNFYLPKYILFCCIFAIQNECESKETPPEKSFTIDRSLGTKQENARMAGMSEKRKENRWLLHYNKKLNTNYMSTLF